MTDETTTPAPDPEVQAQFDTVVEEARANSKLAVESFTNIEGIIGGLPIGNPNTIQNALDALALARSLAHDVLCTSDGIVGDYLNSEAERRGLTIAPMPVEEGDGDMSAEEADALFAAIFGTESPFTGEAN